MVAPRVLLALLTISLTLLVTGGAAAVEVDATDGLTGELEVTTEGWYDFSLTSDGGTRLLIDGTELIGDEGISSGGLWLAAGVHPLEVQVDACCGLVQLFLPDNDVTLRHDRVPEPETILLLGAGLAVLAVAARMRTRAASVER